MQNLKQFQKGRYREDEREQRQPPRHGERMNEVDF
jgi:hypothetical protein